MTSNNNVEKESGADQSVRSTIDALPVGVALFDREHRLYHFNKAFVEQFPSATRETCQNGLSYADVAYMVLRSAKWLDPQYLEANAHASMTDEEVRALTHRRVALVRSAAGPITAEYATWDNRILRSRTVHTDDGRVMNVMVDVTDERRTSRRLSEVVDNIDGAVLLFDQARKLKIWSPSALTLFPFLHPVLTEGVHSDTVREAISAAALPEDRGHLSGNLQMTYVRRLLDGRAIQIRRTPTGDGGLLVVCNDITELQQTNLLASRAQRIESLGMLIAGLAHEINTPLGVAITTCSFIESGLRDILGKHARKELSDADLTRHCVNNEKAADLLLRNLSRAAELIENLKQLSSDELSNDRSRFNLVKIAKDTIEIMGPQIRAGGHRALLNCSDEIWINSYPSAIKQIISNLISNSLVHAYPDGRPGTIRIEIQETETGINLDYFDDGDGVAPALLGRVFEYFFTTRRGKGGTGLGLGIVHNLVISQLSGEIQAASPPGKGLRISIQIPKFNE